MRMDMFEKRGNSSHYSKNSSIPPALANRLHQLDRERKARIERTNRKHQHDREPRQAYDHERAYDHKRKSKYDFSRKPHNVKKSGKKKLYFEDSKDENEWLTSSCNDDMKEEIMGTLNDMTVSLNQVFVKVPRKVVKQIFNLSK